jgi:hypothetical protein
MATKDFTTFVDLVDVAVRDLPSASTQLETLLGIKGSSFGPVTDPIDGSSYKGVEFAVGGIRALRLVSQSPGEGDLAGFLDEREGIWSIRLLVSDVATRCQQAAQRGFQFTLVDAATISEGIVNATVRSTSNGTRYELVQPNEGMPSDADIYVPREQNPTKVQRAYVLDLAVDDMDRAFERYGALLDQAHVPMAAGMDPSSSMKGGHFPTGGLYNIGFLSPQGEPKGPIPAAARAFIDKSGEGAFLLGFHVDVDSVEAHLMQEGIELVWNEPEEYMIGRMQMTSPIVGVNWFYGQWIQGGYEIWRDELDAPAS